MILILKVFLLLLLLLNSIIQSFGCYILLSIYKNGSQSVNQLYIISLSLSEILMSLLIFLAMLIEYYIDEHISHYILTISETGLVLIYYLNMFYITIDKLMEILLNIRYPVYWNEQKAKILLVVTWLVGILFSLSMMFAFRFAKFDYHHSFKMYFYPTVDFTFLAIAFPTYGFLFHKFKNSRNRPTDNNAGGRSEQKLSIYQAFRQSKFYIAALLISAFISFKVVPDLIFMLYAKISGGVPQALRKTCFILHSISFLVDAWIYIIMQKTVKKQFWRMLRLNTYCCYQVISPIPDTGVTQTDVSVV
jgi:hypothetical protein